MKRAIIVFAKKPEAGKVKTRLVPPLSYEEAKELYQCFMKDALMQYVQLAKELNIHIFLAVTPEGSSGYFEGLIAEISKEKKMNADITIINQRGQDLGTRLFNAFTSVFFQGYDQVAITGTDHPTLPNGHIRQCFTALGQKKYDAVIGPAEDGGYYLIGLKKVQVDYFKDIPWSTDKVLNHTLQALTQKGNTVCLLPQWYDVDDKNSLSRMIEEIEKNKIDNMPFYSKLYLHTLKDVEVS